MKNYQEQQFDICKSSWGDRAKLIVMVIYKFAKIHLCTKVAMLPRDKQAHLSTFLTFAFMQPFDLLHYLYTPHPFCSPIFLSL